MTELEQKIYGNGSIKLSRTLTKGITPPNELVLSRLRIERDYAVQNGYITDDGFFIIDDTELSYHTGLSEDAVCACVKNLKRRNFIQSKIVDDFYLICIDDVEILKIVEELEREDQYHYGSWDRDLKKVQKDILKLDLIRKENNNETADTVKKFSELKITRTTEKDNSNDKSALSEHKQ